MIKKLILSLTIITSFGLVAQENTTGPIVFELFTSQGCSSCPAADELLEQIDEKYKDQNVFVLSYHVDYWNRLGWRDPFSSESFSDYQREYAIKFNSRSIYTPQLVVNGNEHFTGSNTYKVNNALEKYAKSKTKQTIVLENVKRDNTELLFSYVVEGQKFNTVTLALVVSERITKIARGENRNRTLKNTNIVANRAVSREKSGNIVLKIPEWVSENDELSIIAYVQNASLQTIGATKKEI